MKTIRSFIFFSSLFISLMFLSFFAILIIAPTNANQPLSPLSDDKETIQNDSVLSINNSEIEKIILDGLEGSTGEYSFSIFNLKTEESYLENENKEYPSASLYKLWLMAVIFDEIEKGNLTMNKKLTADIEVLNKKFGIGSESAELSEGTISLSVEEALNKMITISDNYSALLLSSTVGVSKMSEFLKKYSLNNSKVGTLSSLPMTTAVDTTMYFKLLYSKNLVSEKSSTQMIELLKKQQINDRIPKYLPDNTTVAHKTGELFGFKHDAGIIFSHDGDYIFVALSESKNPKAAAERIALVSEEIFTYFSSR